MSDAETATVTATAPTPSDSQEAVASAAVDALTLTQDQQPKEVDAKKAREPSLRIWPPTQRTREAVTNRLIETLSTPSVLSKRYGTLSKEEAVSAAKAIEEEAYSVASAAASTDEHGVEILQVYSKEISKRMLESVKSRAPSVTVPAPGGDSADSGETPKEDVPPESAKDEA